MAGPRVLDRLFSWTLKVQDDCKNWDEGNTDESGAEVLSSCIRADVSTLLHIEIT